MKKLIILIFVCVLSFNSYSQGTNKTNQVIETRSYLGSFLNSKVRILKDSFFNNGKDLKDSKEEITTLNDSAKELLENSKSSEINPTILKQGKNSLSPCDYSKNDLVWKDKKWQCRKAKYTQDCKASDEEYRIKSGSTSSNYKCVQQGDYFRKDQVWGICQDSIGERHSQTNCYFKNSKTDTVEQIQEDKDYNCNEIPVQRKRQACGLYGSRSTCRCKKGFYYYDKEKKKGFCARQPNLISGSKSYSATLKTDHNGYIFFHRSSSGAIALRYVAYHKRSRITDYYFTYDVAPNYRGPISGIKYSYNSSGKGCRGRSGNISGNVITESQIRDKSPSNYYNFDNRNAAYCPSGGRQWPHVYVTVHGIYGDFEILSETPVCDLN